MTSQKYPVLLVEDDPEWQEILSEVVAGTGNASEIVGSEAAAIAAIERRTYPVAIVDLALTSDSTDHGGFRVLRRLRGLGDTTGAVILTAHGDIEIGAMAKEEFDVVSALSKASFDADRVATLIGAEMESWRAPTASFASAATTLRGGEDVLIWESHIRNLTESSIGTAQVTRNMVEGLVAPVWPIVPTSVNPGLSSRGSDERLVSGLFWSRLLAAPVVLAIGDRQAIADSAESGELAGSWHSAVETSRSVVESKGLSAARVVLEPTAELRGEFE